MTKQEKHSKQIKQPWPTKDAMAQVYSNNLWGGNQAEFYSGEGSHLSTLVDPYIDVLKAFLSSFAPPLKVSDLGCGDFNVGKELVAFTKSYEAVDIVPELIERNRAKFHFEQLTFHCLDIATDKLPEGDCAIVRQVLQHLSNHEVSSVIQKLKSFKYVILTEHLPSGDFVPNKDQISGQGIRLKKNSGIDLLASPFYFKAKDSSELLRQPLEEGKGEIVTTLFVVK